MKSISIGSHSTPEPTYHLQDLGWASFVRHMAIRIPPSVSLHQESLVSGRSGRQRHHQRAENRQLIVELTCFVDVLRLKCYLQRTHTRRVSELIQDHLVL